MTVLFFGFLGFLIILGIFFFCSSIKPEYIEIQVSNEKELKVDSRESSEGDGLMLFDEPLFPEEPEDY